MSLSLVKINKNLTHTSFKSGMEDDVLQTDSTARFVMSKEDGETKVFLTRGNIRQVIMKSESDMPRPNGWISDSMSWEITITRQRICYWAPSWINFSGKEKETIGAATGGYSEYKDIASLGLIPGEKENSVILCIDTKMGDGLFATFLSGTEEFAETIISTLLVRMKEFHGNSDFAVPFNHTIDNFRAAILSELPNIRSKEYKYRTLNLMGPLAHVTYAESEDGEDRVDTVVTDIQSYAEYGVTFKFKDGSCRIDPKVFEARASEERKSAMATEKVVRFCSNCGFDLHECSSSPKFCPKCGNDLRKH